MLIKALQALTDFIIHILKGFYEFLAEFIPLLSKTILLVSPFFLLIYCSYVLGGVKIAVFSIVFVVIVIAIGIVWSRKRNIIDTKLFPSVILLIVFFDLGVSVTTFVVQNRTISLEQGKNAKKAENEEERLAQEKYREMRIKTFLDQLKQSVSGEYIYSGNADDFLHAMNELKEMQAYDTIPTSLIINTLSRLYKYADRKDRKICIVCIEFLDTVKAKDACELLLKIQTERGYLYDKAKSTALKICEQ